MTSAALAAPPLPDWRTHALFLDFDGTLAPIVDRPVDAAIAPATREAVARLQTLTEGALALLSGRGLDDLDALIAPLRPPAAGSHGMEIRAPSGALRRATDAAGPLAAATERVAAYAAESGLKIERKAGAVTLHYRDAPEREAAVRALIEEVAQGEGLRAMHGLMVSEATLPGVDKGAALASFMAEPPFAGRIPVAIGDDTTDEDAFRAAQGMGGFGVRIGLTPTSAHYAFKDIDEFLEWLTRAAAL